MPTVETITSKDAPAAIGPYSQAVKAGGFLYCSGQIALDPSTGVISGANAAEQTARVMANLQAVLREAGCGWKNVVKTTIYLKNIADFAAMNEAYARALGDYRPARATVEVARLPKDALVEIDCIALAH